MKHDELYAHYQSGKYLLLYDVYGKHRRLLYTMTLMELYSHESALNKGRFKNFVNDELQHKVSMDFNGEDLRLFITDDIPSPKKLNKIIGWIAEHEEQPWTFRPIMSNVDCGTFEFAFSNAVTAVAFKLVWS